MSVGIGFTKLSQAQVLSVLEGSALVMNMILSFKLFLIMSAAISCSSAIFIQSKDICNLKRHYRDDIYQVTINDNAINKQFYLKEDAILIAKHLATREINKCAPRDFAD